MWLIDSVAQTVWIVERARGRAVSVESPIGWMPRYEDLDWRGMEDFTPEQFNQLMMVDRDAWQQEILAQEELFIKLYDRLPKELLFIRELILSGLWRSPGFLRDFPLALSASRASALRAAFTARSHLLTTTTTPLAAS